MKRSVSAGLIAVAVVACSTDADPTPVAGRSTVEPPSASTPVAAPATSSADPVAATPDPANDPMDESTTMPDAAAVVPEGFDRVAARVIEPDGSICELCLWLADDADRRARGLMFVTDLGPADGMAFVYPAARTSSFWMKNTLLPLSIAFFDPDGAFLSAFDMEPCTSDPCQRYRTAPDFLVAVETAQGGLPAIGMVAGSTLELLDRPCA